MDLKAQASGVVHGKANGVYFDLNASADFLGNGAIEVNMYETEIFDIVTRDNPLMMRFDERPATGHPTRYFEQTAIAQANSIDPRNVTPTASSPTRVERSAAVKGIAGQTNFTQFDVMVTQQQGLFTGVEARDIEDVISAIEITRRTQLWAGTDTSLTSPTTLQYVGLLTQITQQATIAPGASIIDGLKAMVALMAANITYNINPTAIWINPVLGDYIAREAKASKIELGTAQITAGLTVKALLTEVGELPLISDKFLPKFSGSQYGFAAAPAGNFNYPAAILSEKLVEVPYVSGATQNPKPMLFQLGLLANLQAQYVGIKYDCVVAKGPSYAHAMVAVQRP